MDDYRELQENLFDYFKDVNDKLFVGFVKCFVYHNGTSDTEVTKLVTKFLKDNELTDAYLRYCTDVKKDKILFYSSTLAERTLIEQINHGLLSLSFNRFKILCLK